MLSTLNPSPAWAWSSKQALASVLHQAPAITRVAPSPTGHIHLGTLRTALHNHLAARASGGRFLLRIDDTDTARNDMRHAVHFQHCLDTMGLTPDAVFHQSGRREAHLAAAQSLIATGLAVHDGNAIRLSDAALALLPAQLFDLAAGVYPISATWVDHARGLVLVRSDGSPTYHLASVVDDIDMGINLVVRGCDHLSNTPKHVLLAQALSHASYPGATRFAQQGVYAHIGLILHKGTKLSKRDAASNLQTYLDQGIAPAALLQWVMSLGWGHPDPNFDKTHPMLGLADMPSVFAQGGLRAVNCNLDAQKILSLDRRWKHALRVPKPTSPGVH